MSPNATKIIFFHKNNCDQCQDDNYWEQKVYSMSSYVRKNTSLEKFCSFTGLTFFVCIKTLSRFITIYYIYFKASTIELRTKECHTVVISLKSEQQHTKSMSHNCTNYRQHSQNDHIGHNTNDPMEHTIHISQHQYPTHFNI